ncbi:cold shock domain-containing protein [Nocardia farcinica]|nr:cold shock domain-containing protein [Nocardia farcinica]MBF6295338.1 cold shock domain-containing protein [Nocardia farcinica]MBF6376211.1 cold shock domain-containing protein [Nocardia farcinica]MBF6382010.1 cold shock domain-containing protein [Nocardia farcinica]MBF6421458.1 cold shock domain-containing protein [Nocardia farcinica]
MEHGTMEWLGVTMGNGFINPDHGAHDIFAHHFEIQGEGFRVLAAGQRVEFEPGHFGDGGAVAPVPHPRRPLSRWRGRCPSVPWYRERVADDVRHPRGHPGRGGGVEGRLCRQRSPRAHPCPRVVDQHHARRRHHLHRRRLPRPPELIIPSARDVLDFRLPVAVMFIGVLGHDRS